jgi:unsaturated chondroitin disaccharide hydrolase
LEAFVSENGSTIEFGDFDVETGKMVRHFTVLGAHDDSCGSRGHAWVIAVYLRAYEELDHLRYLADGRKLLKYRADNCDETPVSPWHFKDSQIATDPKALAEENLSSCFVVEQLAWLSLKPSLGFLARDVVGHLEPMMDGLLGHLMVLMGQDSDRIEVFCWVAASTIRNSMQPAASLFAELFTYSSLYII